MAKSSLMRRAFWNHYFDALYIADLGSMAFSFFIAFSKWVTREPTSIPDCHPAHSILLNLA
jgi:hypothetical protein